MSMVMSAAEARRLCSLPANAAVGETLARLSRTDELFTVVYSDYGSRLSLDDIARERPEACVQCGIAEQSQITIASALALEGFHVFAPAYAPFLVYRAFDQVRMNLGVMAAPVVLIGLSSGFGGGDLGASHMALADVALMRAIPSLEVYSPTDNAELVATLEELGREPRPAYVRVTSCDEGACLHGSGAMAPLGEAEALVRPHREADVELVATGAVASRAVAASALLAAQGIAAGVLSMPRVQPLDRDSLLGVADGARLVATVEEHTPAGGLGEVVASTLSDANLLVPQLHITAPARYAQADEPPVLLAHAGLTPEVIARRIAEKLEELD